MERETDHPILSDQSPLGVALSRVSQPSFFPIGAALTSEGEQSKAVVLVLSGMVNLFIRTGANNRLSLGLAGPGEVIGLSETISGRPYELTAIAIKPCRAHIVERDKFLAFLDDNTEVRQRVMQRLSADLGQAYQRARSSVMLTSRAPRS